MSTKNRWTREHYRRTSTGWPASSPPLQPRIQGSGGCSVPGVRRVDCGDRVASPTQREFASTLGGTSRRQDAGARPESCSGRAVNGAAGVCSSAARDEDCASDRERTGSSSTTKARISIEPVCCGGPFVGMSSIQSASPLAEDSMRPTSNTRSKEQRPICTSFNTQTTSIPLPRASSSRYQCVTFPWPCHCKDMARLSVLGLPRLASCPTGRFRESSRTELGRLPMFCGRMVAHCALSSGNRDRHPNALPRIYR